MKATSQPCKSYFAKWKKQKRTEFKCSSIPRHLHLCIPFFSLFFLLPFNFNPLSSISTRRDNVWLTNQKTTLVMMGAPLALLCLSVPRSPSKLMKNNFDEVFIFTIVHSEYTLCSVIIFLSFPSPSSLPPPCVSDYCMSGCMCGSSVS